LFGAGSGNALTKLTKYTATAFFVLVIVLAYMKVKEQGASLSETRRAYEKLRSSTPADLPTAPATPSTNAGIPAPVTPPATMLFNTASNAAPAATTNATPPAAPAK
jgi:hypothetical protein